MGIFNKEDLNQVFSPNEGSIKTLASLKDGVFSKKMMGDGIVVSPSDMKNKKYIIYAPISGKLLTVFPTGHAYGIKSKNGLEVLVHIGLDTVNLNGEGFKSLVKQDQKVKVGQPMAEINLEYINKNAPSSDVIVIVTSGNEIKNVQKGKVSEKGLIFNI